MWSNLNLCKQRKYWKKFVSRTYGSVHLLSEVLINANIFNGDLWIRKGEIELDFRN